MDAAGNIFFTIFTGEAALEEELSPNGHGGWNLALIGTEGGSNGPLLDEAGSLYGTAEVGGTNECGANHCGSVYKLTPGKNGKWTEKTLYSFKGGTKDGNLPVAGVVIDPAGNIYGTTWQGGKYNWGTVFELVAPVGAGSYKKDTLEFQLHGQGAADEQPDSGQRRQPLWHDLLGRIGK